MVLKKVQRAAGRRPHLLLERFAAGRELPQSLSDALGDVNGKGNRTDKYQDYGFDLGVPCCRRRLGVGTMARTAIDLVTLTGTSDSTQFNNNAFKAGAAPSRVYYSRRR